MGKRVESPREERLVILCNETEHDFFKRCAAHAGCNVSEMTRHLFTTYAADYFIPVRRDTPAPLTAEEIRNKVGMTIGTDHRQVDCEALAQHVDPDKLDETNGGYMDPLPSTKR